MDLSFLTIGNKYTRPELAQRWGYESHHAISRGVVTPQGEKIIVLFVTRIKQETLTQYHDYISGDLLFWEGQQKHGTDDRILNAARAGEAIHLFYREVHHSPFEYRGRVVLTPSAKPMRRASSSSGWNMTRAQPMTWSASAVRSTPSPTSPSGRRSARRAWGRAASGSCFWNSGGCRCAVTGVEMPAVLTASHIKPWRCASNVERLDPHNGLLVLPQYDRLFDRGFISFADDGAILVSPALPRDKFDLLGIREDAHLMAVAGTHRPFLAFHRDQVFIRRDEVD